MDLLAQLAAHQKSETRPWHSLAAEDALLALGGDNEGLSEAEARERLSLVGPNVLARSRRESILRLLWRQINNPLIYVLLASASLAVVMGRFIDGAFVFAVVIANTLIGFFQEFGAAKAIDALAKMTPERASVRRAGRILNIAAADVVPGDVVTLQSGDKIPADLRLLKIRGLRVDESPLTGESAPVNKIGAPLAADTSLADRQNMAYGGTLVCHGIGSGVVVATAERTELGRIQTMLKDAVPMETPLTRSLNKVGHWLTIGILAVTAILMVVSLLRGYAPVDAMLIGISLAVAAIPEGLPAIITISMAVGVRRMARRNAIVRKLPAVETLGSTTVICTDKTGTLTRNEMTVQKLWTPLGSYCLSGVGYTPEGELLRDGCPLKEVPADVLELLLAGALCNDAALAKVNTDWVLTGDPTEGALVVAAKKCGMQVEQSSRDWRRIDAIPFESERQYMMTLHEDPEGEQVIYLKGAPEVVLEHSRHDNGRPQDAEVLRQVERMAGLGMRVLAFGRMRPHSILRDLVPSEGREFMLLGLQGMIDPPRPEAIEAVEACHRAGVVVKMITGDHPGTAQAIGSRLGLIARDGRAVTGAALAATSPPLVPSVVASTNVFARVTPEQKLQLVRALQADGQVVAMTGDGVNDAPALKQADIGIAMGISGTDVSKEAADAVLTDDNFASIAAAIEEGRRVYDNLIKSIAFVLPTNLGLALILVVAVLFFPSVQGHPLLPMLPVQILWINLVAAVALALPLAFEAKEPDVLLRPPRRRDEPILGIFVLLRTMVMGGLMAASAIALFLYEYRVTVADDGHSPALARAQTTAVTTVILFQVIYMLQCRSLKHSVFQIGMFTNPLVYVGIGLLLLLHLGFVYLPVMNRTFHTAPIDADAWLKAALVCTAVFTIITAEKWSKRFRARMRRSR